jgi:transglutaminase-like putative cysteine protease/lipoprotein NlpI
MLIPRLILLAGLLAALRMGLAAEPTAPSSKPVAAVANKPSGGTEGNGAGYLIAPPPTWIEPAVEAPGARVDRTSMHYRVIDHQIRLEDRGAEYYSHAVRVVDDTVGLREASQVEFVFDPAYQTLVVHRVDVVRAGYATTRLDPQRVRMLQRETQLEQRIYDGRQTFSLVLDDVRVGDEIDIAYSLRGTNPVFEGKFVHNQLLGSIRGPVALYQLRILSPLGRKVEFKPGSSNIRASSRSLGSYLETVVRREAVPPMQFEEGASPSSRISNEFFASEYAGWGDVVRWGIALFASPADAMPAVDRKAKEIIAAYPAPRERARAALDFVQRDIRYFGTELGVNSHRPASPEKVIQQRFGDCKDKVSLLLALLHRMGIAGEPYLVSTSLRGKVAEALPSPLSFNHVIARVTVDGQVYWLDATRSQQTGPLEMRQAIGFGQGLLLAAETTAPSAQPSAFGTQRIRVDDRFSIQALSAPPVLESRVTFYNELAEAVRSQVADGQLDAVKTQFSEDYVRLYPKIKSLQAPAIEELPEKNALVLVQRFAVPEFFRFHEQRLLSGEVAAWSLLGMLQVPSSEKRRDAFAVALPGIYSHHIIFTTQEDLGLGPGARQGDSADAFFALHFQLETTAKAMELSAELALKAEEIPATEWSEHLAELAKAHRMLVYSVKIPTVAPSKLDALRAEMKSVAEDMRDGRVKAKTNLQREARLKVVALNYQIESGRLSPSLLAEALTERGIHHDNLGQPELGARDFEHALALVPDRKETLIAAAVNASSLGQSERVMALTDAVLKQDPNNSEALSSRMWVHYMNAEYGRAKEELELLLQDDAEWRRGYYFIRRALTLRYLGQPVAPPDPVRAAKLTDEWPRPLIDWLLEKVDAEASCARPARALRRKSDFARPISTWARSIGRKVTYSAQSTITRRRSSRASPNFVETAWPGGGSLQRGLGNSPSAATPRPESVQA